MKSKRHLEDQRRLHRAWSFRFAYLFWLAAPPLFFLKHALYGGLDFLFALPELALGLMWLAFPFRALFVAVSNWRRGAVVGALVSGAVPIVGVLVVLYGRDVSDDLHFRVARPRYVAALEAARLGDVAPGVEIDVGPPTVAFFDWGSFLESAHGVIYDETDEIAKPPELRSATWPGRRVTGMLDCPADMRALGGHFYVAYIGC